MRYLIAWVMIGGFIGGFLIGVAIAQDQAPKATPKVAARVKLRGGPFNGYTAKGGPDHLVFPRSVPYSPDRNQGTPVDDNRNTTVDDVYEKTNAFDANGMRVYRFVGTEIR